MEYLGYLALVLALCLSVYAIVTSLTGKLKRNLFLEVSAQRAVMAAWVLMTISSGALLYLILSNDFRISYVVSRSNADMSILYKFAAWWGGQEGSILFWTWILASGPSWPGTWVARSGPPQTASGGFFYGTKRSLPGSFPPVGGSTSPRAPAWIS